MKSLFKIFIVLSTLFFAQYSFAQKKAIPEETKRQVDKKIIEDGKKITEIDKEKKDAEKKIEKKTTTTKKQPSKKKKEIIKEEITDTLPLDSKSTGKVLTGVASFYSASFEGKQTANGEIFRHSKMTCACNKLPLGTWLKITNVKNGKFIIAKVNDRMHPRMKRLVDLTLAGAKKLDFVSAGLTQVKAEVIKKK